MLLSEILDVKLNFNIDVDDRTSLTKTYIVDKKKITGADCVSGFIIDTLSDSVSEFSDQLTKEKNTALFKITIEDVVPSDKETPLTIGPNRYITILYKVKIRNGIALKYHLITNNGSLKDKETWEAYLRPSIFFAILNNQDVANKLKEVKLNDFIGQKKKKNNDMSFTRYEYAFYNEEKAEWADNNRLKDVYFKDGYLYINMDMPVFEKKAPAEDKENELEKVAF
jgi:hypothetical protein